MNNNHREQTEDFVVRLDYDTSGTIIQLPSDLHNEMSKWVQAMDQSFGIDLHCYSNDDYLFIAFLLRRAYSIYHILGCDPRTGKWSEGCKAIPYTVVFLQEKPVLLEDADGNLVKDTNGSYIPDDKGLNAGICGPFLSDDKEYYVLQFNRYILQRYIIFLQQIFDKNEELIMDISESQVTFCNGEKGTAKEALAQFPLVTRDKLFEDAQGLFKSGLWDAGDILLRYAASLDEAEKVPLPTLLFLDEEGDGKEKLCGFAYVDAERQLIKLPLRKKIYNTSGFYDYFGRRNTLISELFIESIRMIVYHEFSHIANGHGLLSRSDEAYTKRKDIAVCAEQNADDFAIRLMVCELLFNTADGNPGSQRLKYTRKELIHKWSVRIFASYLALSWIYREDDRVWSEKTVDDYIAKRDAKHPIYQFRTFNVINCAFNRLNDLVQNKEQYLITVEGYPIDETVVRQTIDETMDMLNSFEASFRMTYTDNRSIEEKTVQSWRMEKKSIPKTPQEIPFMMTSFSKRAGKEAERIRQTWPELKKRLEQVGAYNLRFSKI
ncbi:MAG: hypothetical protein HPZ79_02185 [Oscillospiraceae bacterium]|nr:hypothetical protein [Oscillospiraceae bacterium]